MKDVCGWNMGLAQREAQIAARETSKNLGLRALTSTDFLCVDSAGYIVVRRDGDVYWTCSNIYTQTGSKAQGAWHYQQLGTKKRHPWRMSVGGIWGSNPWHSEPQSDALPTELKPPCYFLIPESECKSTAFFWHMQGFWHFFAKKNRKTLHYTSSIHKKHVFIHYNCIKIGRLIFFY